MKSFYFNLLVISLLGISCTSTAHLKTNTSAPNYDATNPENIEIYSIKEIGKPYQVLGEVVASKDAGKNAATTVNALKKEASKIGADAIVDLRLEFGYGFWATAIKATGTAVKFTNE